jgi:rhodanese-related sulfurtransferase
MVVLMGINELLTQVREGVTRVEPSEVAAAVRTGALLVDTRTEKQRRLQGELPDAIVIDRTVLEWRLDPQNESCISEVSDYSQRIIVACQQGFSSSIAAHSLRSIGLLAATDMVGGVEKWLLDGLPTRPGPADVRD